MKIRATIDREDLERALERQKDSDEIVLDIEQWDLDEWDIHNAFDIEDVDDVRSDSYDEGYDKGVEDTKDEIENLVKSDLRDLRDMIVVGKSDAKVLSKLKKILRDEGEL